MNTQKSKQTDNDQQHIVDKIQLHFADLDDPRTTKVTYPLNEIIVITICAVICGADDFVSIAEFGEAKQQWFASFLKLENGIPSHDRFNAILAAIKPQQFEKCLLNLLKDIHDVTDGRVIAVDGKTLRRSYDKASSKSAIHMVSAWATENHISLGQVVTDAKSNEITAIPKLLEMLEIEGSLITIDAMGCQKKIAQKIVDSNADYSLAVKKNQPLLHKSITEQFEAWEQNDYAKAGARKYQNEEKNHGRE